MTVCPKSRFSQSHSKKKIRILILQQWSYNNGKKIWKYVYSGRNKNGLSPLNLKFVLKNLWSFNFNLDNVICHFKYECRVYKIELKWSFMVNDLLSHFETSLVPVSLSITFSKCCRYQKFAVIFHRLAAKLLQRLCHERLCQDSVQEHQGIPILLSQLHCDNVNLLLPVVQCLIHMCTNPEANKEIRQMGGIPTILALLRFVACPDHFFSSLSFNVYSYNSLLNWKSVKNAYLFTYYHHSTETFISKQVVCLYAIL